MEEIIPRVPEVLPDYVVNLFEVILSERWPIITRTLHQIFFIALLWSCFLLHDIKAMNTFPLWNCRHTTIRQWVHLSILVWILLFQNWWLTSLMRMAIQKSQYRLSYLRNNTSTRTHWGSYRQHYMISCRSSIFFSLLTLEGFIN